MTSRPQSMISALTPPSRCSMVKSSFLFTMKRQLRPTLTPVLMDLGEGSCKIGKPLWCVSHPWSNHESFGVRLIENCWLSGTVWRRSLDSCEEGSLWKKDFSTKPQEKMDLSLCEHDWQFWYHPGNLMIFLDVLPGIQFFVSGMVRIMTREESQSLSDCAWFVWREIVAYQVYSKLSGVIYETFKDFWKTMGFPAHVLSDRGSESLIYISSFLLIDERLFTDRNTVVLLSGNTET